MKTQVFVSVLIIMLCAVIFKQCQQISDYNLGIDTVIEKLDTVYICDTFYMHTTPKKVYVEKLITNNETIYIDKFVNHYKNTITKDSKSLSYDLKVDGVLVAPPTFSLVCPVYQRPKKIPKTNIFLTFGLTQQTQHWTPSIGIDMRYDRFTFGYSYLFSKKHQFKIGYRLW